MPVNAQSEPLQLDIAENTVDNDDFQGNNFLSLNDQPINQTTSNNGTELQEISKTDVFKLHTTIEQMESHLLLS